MLKQLQACRSLTHPRFLCHQVCDLGYGGACRHVQRLLHHAHDAHSHKVAAMLLLAAGSAAGELAWRQQVAGSTSRASRHAAHGCGCPLSRHASTACRALEAPTHTYSSCASHDAAAAGVVLNSTGARVGAPVTACWTVPLLAPCGGNQLHGRLQGPTSCLVVWTGAQQQLRILTRFGGECTGPPQRTT
jgi:hypothetical protein